MTRTARPLLHATAIAAALALGGGTARAEDDIPPAEAEAARLVEAATARIAIAPDGHRPPPDAAEASGALVGKDRVAVTSRTARRIAGLPKGVRAWARVGRGEWSLVEVLGIAWFADVGVLRWSGTTTAAPLRFHRAPRSAKSRVIAAAVAGGCEIAVRGAPLGAVEWFDPSADGGRYETKRLGPDREGGKGAYPTYLRTAESIVGRAADGTPVVDAAGRCLGLVVSVDADRPSGESVRVRTADVLSVWVDRLVADEGFHPADLGIRFEPLATPPGEPARLPSDLAAMRATGKERGGAVVGAIERSSPAAGILWPGDLVLEIESKAFFGEIAETHAAVFAAMAAGAPADVVVWRGGKRERVSVTAKPGRELYASFVAETDARAARLLPR